MEKTVKINLLVVGLALLLVFALGALTRREVVNRKEIRSLTAQISGSERIVAKMTDTITLKSDTIKQLKETLQATKGKIKVLQGEIKILDSQIANFVVTLPPNEVYAELQDIRPDTLKKEWPFSTPQINGIYEDEYELVKRKQEVFKYESITGMLNYSLEIAAKSDSIKSQQLETCLNVTEEYQKMSALKDKQIKEWMKRGRGRTTWGLTSTGVAAVFLLLLLIP
jgi:hypothetical protein